MQIDSVGLFCVLVDRRVHIDIPCAASTHACVRYRAAQVSMNRLKLRRKKDIEVKLKYTEGAVLVEGKLASNLQYWSMMLSS